MIHDPFISTRQAAMLHDVAESTIWAWVGRGLLEPAFRVGRKHYYRTSDVDEAEYVARRRDMTGRAGRRLG